MTLVRVTTSSLFGDSVLNLKSEVHLETHDYTDMYSGMAKAAREEGFTEIADWFEAGEKLKSRTPAASAICLLQRF